HRCVGMGRIDLSMTGRPADTDVGGRGRLGDRESGMQTAERFTASVEEWTCPCGRQNAAGLSMCPHCGRVPPRGVRTITMAGPVPGRPLAPPPRVRGIRLAVGVILLNILVQGVTIGLVQAGRMERSKAIALGLWLGVAFY